MEMALFNVNDGFAEAVVRGYRSAFLSSEDYRRLGASDNLEDVRTALDETDYAPFLQDEPAPLLPAAIVARCRDKLASEFKYVRLQVDGKLGQFLDFIRYEKMIDNIVMIIQGTINNKSPKELLSRVDPLGWFEELRTIPSMDFSQGYDDLYRTILIDTPIAPYFREFLESVAASDGHHADVSTILTETDLEIMRNILKKVWLEDFNSFCTETLSGTATAEMMGALLSSEADFRVLMVTLNALNSPLGTTQQIADRNALYPSFGSLYPDGTNRIRRAWNEQTVRTALEPYEKFAAMYEQCKQFYDKDNTTIDHSKGRFKSIEDLLFVELEKLYELCFENQFHYGVFYAWVKLHEQEIRNIEWICNMIQMGRKQHVEDIVPLFQQMVLPDLDLSAPGDVSALLFHPEEQMLLAGSLSGNIAFVLFTDDNSVERVEDFKVSKAAVRCLEYSNGKIVSADSAGRVSLSSFDPKVISRWKLAEDGINAICSVGDSLIVCGDDEGSIYGIDPRVKKGTVFTVKEQTDFISSIIVAQKDAALKTVVATSGDCTLGVYDFRTMSDSSCLVAMSDEQEDELNCSLLMNSELHVLTGEANGVVGVWKQGFWGDVKDRIPLYNKGIDGACSVEFLKKVDPKRFVATTSDGIIRLMNLYPNTTEAIIGVHRTSDNKEVATVNAMDCDTDMGIVATCSGDGIVKFWDIPKHEEQHQHAKRIKTPKPQHQNPEKASRQGFFGDI